MIPRLPSFVRDLAITFTLATSAVAFAAGPQTPKLRDVPEGRGWKGDIAAVRLTEKNDAPAIEFTASGQKMVWLDGFEFGDGVIEFDARGRSEPVQGSFIGVAFRVRDAKTFDAVYFRPFNFRAADPDRKAHAVQYISEPDWTWQRLRKEKTGQFEKPIEPAPDGDAWFHAKIVIQKRRVQVFVNGAKEPALAVDELGERKGGSVGLWCNSYGVIAHLSIQPAR